MEHPRWGLILTVTPYKDIKAGEEILCYYQYQKAKFPIDYPWYWDQKMALEKEERLEQEKKLTKKKKIKKQKSAKNQKKEL